MFLLILQPFTTKNLRDIYFNSFYCRKNPTVNTSCAMNILQKSFSQSGLLSSRTNHKLLFNMSDL